MHVPISICLRFVSLIQIEYAFDYVILFALNEKWCTPHQTHNYMLCYLYVDGVFLFFLYVHAQNALYFILCRMLTTFTRISIDVLSFMSLIQL